MPNVAQHKGVWPRGRGPSWVRRRWGAAAFAALMAALGAAPAWAGEIAVVVNEQSPIQALSPEQVRALFLGERRFWGKVRVFPVTYSENAPIMRTFLNRVLGMDANAYKVWWIQRIFRDGDVPPARAGSAEEALRAVAANAGGIGFVDAEAVAGSDGVRAVYRFPG
jgi:ABC-type phosphate transport system substrate-binding protein